MAEHELVRPSRDGDQFHYHWAARHCLGLLAGMGDLRAVSIEGPSTSEGASAVDDGEELVDVGLYYGNENFADARFVHYIQLKHSTRQASVPWTASGLDKTLRGFAKRFIALQHPDRPGLTPEKVRFTFTTNRPIDIKVIESLEDLRSSAQSRHPTVQATLLRYTELSEEAAERFFQLFSVEGGEPDLWAQRNLLSSDVSQFLAGADYESPLQLKELVSRKATSEFASDPSIRRLDVLRALGVTEPELSPAPCLIQPPAICMTREQEAEVLASVLNATTPVVLHADGGVGKSTLASRLAAAMPCGSVAVLYDCFGDGMYRNAMSFRHRHRDALVQMANELAGKGLCYPLIPSAHIDVKSLMQAFHRRLEQCMSLLTARTPGASILLIIDAADNADMAAEERGESAFVQDLITTKLPDGVRLALTCRSHRRARLKAPSDAVPIQLRPFNLSETGAHLRATYPEATNKDVAEFAWLTSANPRVQALVISQSTSLNDVLSCLGPGPTTIESAINDLLQRSLDKLREGAGRAEGPHIELLCQGLATLRPPVPIPVLAAISSLPESAVRSFALDLGRPLFMKSNTLHFLDEPAETWFRERFKPTRANLDAFIERLMPLASNSSYVAATLPQLLLSGERIDDLVRLALSEESLPTTNPLERRDVELQRLHFAIKACLRTDRYPAAAKLALKAAGEAAGEARQISLIQSNTDLAAGLLSAERIQELVAKRTFEAGWLGSNHAYDAGVLSGQSELLPEAGSQLRMAMEWLMSWGRLPEKERENEQVSDHDRAEMALAHLQVDGAAAAVGFLRLWRPQSLVFKAGLQLASRLVDMGKFGLLDALAVEGTADTWLLLAIAREAGLVGHHLPVQPLRALMQELDDSQATLEYSAQAPEQWLLLEAVTAAVTMSLKLLPRTQERWAETIRRYLPTTPPHELSSFHGGDTSPLLRAYALHSALLGEKLELESLAPPQAQEQLSGDNRRGRARDVSALKMMTGGILPWFVLGAEIACHRTPVDIAAAIDDALTVTDRVARDDHQRIFNGQQIAAIEWARLLRDSAELSEEAIRTFRGWLDKSPAILDATGLIAICRIASRTEGLSNLALDLSVQAFAWLDQHREHAETQIEGIQQLARAVYTVSRREAGAYFARAVEIASRIGEENTQRWSALLQLAEAGAAGALSRPRTAYRLSRAAELTYEYVYRDKHFDWGGTVSALSKLCGSSTLAILSRWRDRGFGDPDRLIRFAINELVSDGQLSAVTPVALLGLAAGWDSLQVIRSAIDDEPDIAKRKQILHTAFRYCRVQPHGLSDWSAFASLATELGTLLPDGERLLRFAEMAEDNGRPTVAAKAGGARPEKDGPDWDALFAGIDLEDPNGLLGIRNELQNADQGSRTASLMKEAVARASPGALPGVIDAIAAWPTFGIFDLKDLIAAIPSTMVSLLSVRNALKEAVLTACRNNPELAQRKGWGNVLKFENLYAAGVLTEHAVVTAVLEGYGRKEDFESSDFFALIDPLASRLTADQADEVLGFGLDLLESILQPADGDGPWHERLHPPAQVIDALAGYLWVRLGSPAAAERWKAAHVARSCIELEYEPLIRALAARASSASPAPFTDQRLDFYQWHAHQWFLFAVAHAARDKPDLVMPLLPFLKTSTIQEHVIIRHYAAEAMMSLHQASYLAADEVGGLNTINAGELPLWDYSGWRAETEEQDALDGDDAQAHSFDIDISQYWFSRLGRVFGLSATTVERMALDVIRRELGNPGNAQDDARYTLNLFKDQATRHSHGSLPRVDDRQAYQAYHAMMILAARLLKTHPIGRSEYSAQNDFEEWLKYLTLTRADGRWTADRRDPSLVKQVEKPTRYGDTDWCWEITRESLDRHWLADDGLRVVWGDWRTGDQQYEETVSIRSALVTKNAAGALLAALQTAPNPDAVYFPTPDATHLLGGKSLAITLWVEEEGGALGLDEYDPWAAGLSYPGPGPTMSTVGTLGLTTDADNRLWQTPTGAMLRSEVWATAVGFDRDEEYISGTRLSVDASFMAELLAAYPNDCLLIRTSVRRRLPGHDRTSAYEPRPWPYERYFLVENDGIT
ncbi:NACHT domain-containing protein [Pseudomonas silvicola]|nr:NACHT domain-containing protein [Pseudomonas silvicola]